MHMKKYLSIFISILAFITLIAVYTALKDSQAKPDLSKAMYFTIKSAADGKSISSSVTPSITENSNNKLTVVVDAGHGSVDSGSVGQRGTLEKDMTLSIALKLGKKLESQGINVVYTRTNDNISWAGQKEELLSRAEISNKNSADLFISIHLNSSEYKEVRGTETYYHPTSKNGKKLATFIQKHLVAEIGLKDRGIRAEDFSVLRNVSATSVLVELGYLSNYKEEAILMNKSYHDKFAKAISDGILKYIAKP